MDNINSHTNKGHIFRITIIISSLAISLLFINHSNYIEWLILSPITVILLIVSFYIWPDYRFKTEVIRRLLSPWLWVPVLLVLAVATVDMIWPTIGNILQYIPIIPLFILFALYKFGYIDKWKTKFFENKIK